MTGPTRTLLPQHAALIKASGISAEVAAQRGYWSARSEAELARLGFARAQQIVPALVVPVWGVAGRIVLYQIRPDRPRVGKNGKARKYETPAGARMALDVPPVALAQIRDPAAPLFITEGVRKADSAVSRRLCCVALLGVWNFRGTNERGGKTVLPDWESVALNGRPVYVAYDSDVMTNPKVTAALARLKAFLESRRATVTLLYLPPGKGKAKTGLDDYFAAGGTADALVRLTSPTSRPDLSPDAVTKPNGQPERASQARMLIDLATAAGLDLFHDTDGETCYAGLDVDGRKETWAIRSDAFRHWITLAFYERYGKPPSAQALTDAVWTLRAKAQREGPARDVHVRVARVGEDAIYLDLANDNRDVVEITSTAWRLVNDCPVKFRRPRGILPLPVPERGGSVDDLRPFVNVPDEKAWKLFVGWMVAALNPARPCPVLVLLGEQGSAKSTAERMAQRLLDPNAAELRTPPQDERDIMIAARNGHVLSYDNVSRIPEWFSDALCRLVTGSAMGTRQLYTDADETLFSAMRPVVLNGIEEMVTRADLLDRSLLVDLPRISEQNRRVEGDLWKNFDRTRPRILGALLYAVSGAMRNRARVSLPRRPRMVDFATWATAAEASLGWDSDSFMEAYAANRGVAADLALEASPVASAVLKFAETKLPTVGSIWQGTATDLLQALTMTTDETVRKQKSWPNTAKTLSDALRRAAPALAAVGVSVEFSRRGRGGTRTVTLARPALPALGDAAVTSAMTQVGPTKPAGKRVEDADDAGDAFPPALWELTSPSTVSDAPAERTAKLAIPASPSSPSSSSSGDRALTADPGDADDAAATRPPSGERAREVIEL